MAKREIKIILGGLDNAGKSSLLVSLKKMYDYENDINLLKPTIRIDYFHRNFLDLHLNILDMGGQEKYREKYLKRPQYFEELDILIYLFDIQDDARFNESLKYLEKILNILDETGFPKHIYPVYICFSKSDGYIVEHMKEDFHARVKMMKKGIISSFQGFSFEFYQTTIYSIFSISHLISNTIKPFNQFHNQFDEIFTNFIQKFHIEYCCLFDNSGLLITEKSLKELEKNEKIETNLDYDFMISNHLGFSMALKDENLEIQSNQIFEAGKRNILYQFTIDEVEIIGSANAENSSKNDEGEIPENFFISIIINQNTDRSFEEDLPQFIDSQKEYLKKMYT